MKRVLGIGALLLLVAFAVGVYLVFSGPRMRVQPHIGAYEAYMPLPPEGAVPVELVPSLPSPAEAESLANPLGSTEENRGRGQVYYQYYCAFCHGAKGDGNGPVGPSYVPPAADLRSKKIHSYSDGELLRATLLGTGHEPVLERVVAPDRRWYIVLYVRSLGSASDVETP